MRLAKDVQSIYEKKNRIILALKISTIRWSKYVQSIYCTRNKMLDFL